MSKVEVKKRDERGWIIIKNPPQNTLSTEVFLELKKHLEELKKDKSIKVVIIMGEGLFSTGAEVTEINQMAQKGDQAEIKKLLEMAHDIVSSIENLGKPTIAAINSYCLGGGNEIAMACTARIATEEAQFGQPEINLGIMPGLGGTQRLPRLIGLEQALKMLITGTMSISAKQAKEMGLIDEVVPTDDDSQLRAKAKEFATKILAQPIERKTLELRPLELHQLVASEIFQALLEPKSQAAAGAIIRVVRDGMNLPLAEALKLEIEEFAKLLVTPDAKEGLTAFTSVPRRKPDFPSLAKVKTEKEAEIKPEEKAPESTPQTEQELQMLRKTIHDFARKEIEPHIEEMEASERVPSELLKKMAQLGFFGVCFPEKYGGSDFGKIGYCVLFEELARVHASTAVVAGAHVGIGAGPIALFGTEEQKKKYLTAAICGKMLGAFALTEPEAGSDAANVQTTAVKEGNKWIINGTKQFITNGDIADFVITIAQTDKFLGTNGLTAFIVEKTFPGFSVVGTEKKMGIHASTTATLAFDNMEVPEENILGGIGEGFKIFMTTLNYGRLGLAAGCLGMAKAAFELAYKHASQRKQFGKFLIEQEAIQFYFAEMRADIQLMESTVYDVARKADQGKDIREEAAILKLKCSEMCSDIIDKALQIHGGYGYIEDYPICRMYRDARINRIFEGTNEIQKLLIFKEIYKNGGKI